MLNGHIDVFPADEQNERWTHAPWSGAIADGKIYGRGVVDMKAGTSASIFTYAYLYRIREYLKGRLTLTAVSDEETFGPWGARYLMEHHPEVHGDCLLNGEPSSPLTIRFGEKGPLWLRFTTRTRGAHGAYTHLTSSATKVAARLIIDLEDLTTLQPSVPIDVADALAGAVAAIDEAQGSGAKDILQRVTVPAEAYDWRRIGTPQSLGIGAQYLDHLVVRTTDARRAEVDLLHRRVGIAREELPHLREYRVLAEARWKGYVSPEPARARDHDDLLSAVDDPDVATSS